MLNKRPRSMVMRRKVSLASMPSVQRRVRQVSGDNKQARTRPIFFVSPCAEEMGAGGGGHHSLKRDAFTGLWMTAAFLAACGICAKPLAGKDAYIYRSEFAFCTMECREKYIEKDIKMENKRRLISIRKAPSDQSGSGGGSCSGTGKPI
ncbi:FCS-Like Zinc finger 7-like [Triticum urartu]|uniref:FLZ-type domain-containing protein n=2 Tax=Triticum urartu TaxID=4572 RepID=A0A8R7UU28_TRIUA|nr:FCS-Like Zinc finger 7-like [Triticum urartu]